LVTVPLAGFSIAAFILIYTVFNEGIGALGTIHSVSFLDQVDRHVVAIDRRTVFAGVSPQRLEYPVGGFLGNVHESRGDRPLFAMDAAAGWIDGAWLPSRQPTTFVTVVQQACRERLRVLPDAGRVEVSDGLRIVDDGTGIVLRDFGGAYWSVRADGKMREIEGAAAERVIDSLVELLGGAQRKWLRGVIGPLEPGSYAGLFSAHPAFDDHGVHVEYGAEIHILRGTLDPRDVVK
jgi:hypothetical protein